MAFELPPLPYPREALEPHVSARTLEFHHGKHHATYVETLNKLVAGTPLENASLEEVIMASSNNPEQQKIFNNAAQVWNHTFFWHCMKKGGGGVPGDAVKSRIEKDLGGLDAFRTAFLEKATTQFGSGWAWLVVEGGSLKVVNTPNAVNPMANGQHAILTCDVWEHAYYLDYQNRRAAFVEAFLDHLVNWDFVAEKLNEAGQSASGQMRQAGG